MPLRWYGTSDKSDPLYKHYARVVNLVVHGMLFAALNSGLWFFQEIRHPWQSLGSFTAIWAAAWLVHLLVVVGLRPKNNDEKSPAGLN